LAHGKIVTQRLRRRRLIANRYSMRVREIEREITVSVQTWTKKLRRQFFAVRQMLGGRLQRLAVR